MQANIAQAQGKYIGMHLSKMTIHGIFNSNIGVSCV